MAPTQFGAELSALRLIGEVDLPMLAYTYAVCNNNVAGTASSDPAAFTPRENGGNNDVGAEWTALRDRLQNILGHTSNTLTQTAQVIMHIMRTYEATDAESARYVADAWGDGAPGRSTEVAPGSPPPVVLK
jgi:hypothetical protein